MDDNSLNLPVGTTLQIQATVPDGAPRYKVKVVGYVPGLSLIVNTPVVDRKVQIIRPGQRFTVRLLRGSSVVAFVSQVQAAPVKPFPHLHLEFPDVIEQVNIRNSARVNANLAAKVRNTEKTDVPEHYDDATIVDLSESGVRLASTKIVGEKGDSIQINFRVEVLKKVEALSLVGDIMNVTERTSGEGDNAKTVYFYGVRFSTVSRYQQVLMYAWVMNNLVENRGGGA